LPARKLFFGALLSERDSNFLLLDARHWMAALTEILLFGAITHHAGMRHLDLFLGAIVLLGAMMSRILFVMPILACSVSSQRRN
jgi:hypothetical protein